MVCGTNIDASDNGADEGLNRTETAMEDDKENAMEIVAKY